jgi:hypothetical protein
MVRREMERTYGHDSVAAVNVVTDTRNLDPLLTKYNASKQKLDDLTSSYSEWGLGGVGVCVVCVWGVGGVVAVDSQPPSSHRA